jgi:hypothetical protein
MKPVSEFLFNVIAFWVLVVGGMSLAGIIENRTFYPLSLLICLLPAMFFIKFRLPLTWKRFVQTIIFVSIITIVLTLSELLSAA